MTEDICSYIAPDGRTCGRPVLKPGAHCSLHLGCERRTAEDSSENAAFEADFARVVSERDGNWQGFIFPRRINLPSEIDFPVNAGACVFNHLHLEKVVFRQRADFTAAVFRDGLILSSVVFEDAVVFDRCRFEGPTDLQNVNCKKEASFRRADFSERTILRVNFCGVANFHQAVFREGAHFAGWRNLTLRVTGASISLASLHATGTTGGQLTLRHRIRLGIAAAGRIVNSIWKQTARQATKFGELVRNRLRSLVRQFATTDADTTWFRMFEAEGQFQEVVFLRPDQTMFSDVDLSRVYFGGTNLRGVRFLGATWWQPALRRNGLYDELLIRLSKDGPFRHRNLPLLEETCRNVRVALEDNRSFGIASDFYVGEMEAAAAQLRALRRHLLSVNALYRFTSRYGTSVGTALRVLVLLYVFDVTASVLINFNGDALTLLTTISDAALRAFRVMMLQNLETVPSASSVPQTWLDSAFRMLSLIQGTMVVLAFRSRTKRH